MHHGRAQPLFVCLPNGQILVVQTTMDVRRKGAMTAKATEQSATIDMLALLMPRSEA